MKIVIDTNVLLSALFSKNGASNRLLLWLFSKEQRYNVISNTLATEFEDVLSRDENLSKFNGLSKKDVNRFIDDIALISYHQEINFLWRPFLRDVKDDMVLEVAFNANANYIITGNIKDFKKVEDSFDIEIVSPRDFLKLIGE